MSFITGSCQSFSSQKLPALTPHTCNHPRTFSSCLQLSTPESAVMLTRPFVHSIGKRAVRCRAGPAPAWTRPGNSICSIRWNPYGTNRTPPPERPCGVPESASEAGPSSPGPILRPMAWIAVCTGAIVATVMYTFSPMNDSYEGNRVRKMFLGMPETFIEAP